MSEMFQELLSSNPYAIIELFELHLRQDLHGSDEIVYFHAGANEKATTGEVIWQGNTYQALPIEADGFEYNGTGQLPRPTLRVANLLGTVSALLLGVNSFTPGNDLTGAKVIRIRTLSRFLDPANFENDVNPYGTPANEEMPREIYYIDRKSVENRDIVEFELAAVFDLAGVRAPKRQVIANICQWKYRSAECGYTGTNYFDENDFPLGATPAPNIPSTVHGYELTIGETLGQNDYLVSPNGWYRAVMQADGDFVVYNKANTAVWATATTRGFGGSYTAEMLANGNFAIKSAGTIIWQTNTSGKGEVSSISFAGWYPTDVTVGRSGAFGWECVGSSPTYAGQTSVQNETFTLGSRTITVQFQFSANEWMGLDPHYSGESYIWSTIDSATVVSSSGTFYTGEVLSLQKTLSPSNPFRSGHPQIGTLTTAGPAYTITGIVSTSDNRLILASNGLLTVTTGGGINLWASSYLSIQEPLVQTGTADPLQDVCGKRLTSCRKRFGDYAPLPFGSYPGVGSFYQ